QQYLRSIPYNREVDGETCYSFRRMLRENRAHCLEGAIAAAVILEQHGYPPVVVSIESRDKLDHVLWLFKRNGKLGSVARSRDIGFAWRHTRFRHGPRSGCELFRTVRRQYRQDHRLCSCKSICVGNLRLEILDA